MTRSETIAKALSEGITKPVVRHSKTSLGITVAIYEPGGKRFKHFVYEGK